LPKFELKIGNYFFLIKLKLLMI